MPDALQIAFARAGRGFAGDIRRLLPLLLSGTPEQRNQARIELQRAADQASKTMRQGGRAWLVPALTRSVLLGQQRASRELGVRFNVPNVQLIERLAREAAPRIADAADSTRPFLGDALTRTTAFRAQLVRDGVTKVKSLGDVNRTALISQAKSALIVASPQVAKRRLLEDLGLQSGDRVLFLSGRRMSASAYASTVTRTRNMEALNQAKAETYVDNGYRFIMTSSHAGVDPDDICFYLQGTVWALVPNPEGIPLLPAEYGLPPWHPNCVHTYGPWIPALNGGARGIASVLRKHETLAKKLAAFEEAA